MYIVKQFRVVIIPENVMRTESIVLLERSVTLECVHTCIIQK